MSAVPTPDIRSVGRSGALLAPPTGAAAEMVSVGNVNSVEARSRGVLPSPVIPPSIGYQTSPTGNGVRLWISSPNRTAESPSSMFITTSAS